MAYLWTCPACNVRFLSEPMLAWHLNEAHPAKENN